MKYTSIINYIDYFQALLTGLAIMCPDDPYQFVIDKLHSLQNEKVMEALEW